MNSLLRSGRCDSRRGTCEASTASKTTNALIHHSCESCAMLRRTKTSSSDPSVPVLQSAAYCRPVCCPDACDGRSFKVIGAN